MDAVRLMQLQQSAVLSFAIIYTQSELLSYDTCNKVIISCLWRVGDRDMSVLCHYSITVLYQLAVR